MILETERLLLRPFEPDDLDAVAAIHADPEVMRFMGGVMTREQAAAWIERHRRAFEESRLGRLAIVERESREVVGRSGLAMFDLPTPEVELGWTVRRDLWGRGYATEASRATLRLAAELRLARVVSVIRPDNTASLRVAEKLGARHEQDVVFEGAVHGLYVHALPGR